MAGDQSGVAGRALDFLASFARDTKNSLSIEVCRIYIKQVLDDSESLEMAACALQAAIIAKNPPRRIQQDRYWRRLLEKFPNHEKASDEKRLVYNLTAIWTKEVLEHYGWHGQKKRFLQPLYQCAKTWPRFEFEFIPAANCVLISRHEACILGRGHKKLKTIGFHHQTKSSGFARPFSIGDVELLAKWSKRVKITAYGGEGFPERPSKSMLKHVEEWAEDTDGSVIVDGMSLKARGSYHQAYNVMLDRYGLVVHYDKKEVPRCPAKKRRRENLTSLAEDALMEGDNDQTPSQKRTRMNLDSVYPSPPRSSPQSSIVSSLRSAVDGGEERDIDTDEESSGAASTNGADSLLPAEVDSSNTAEISVREVLPSVQREMHLQAHPNAPSTDHDHLARPSSTVYSHCEIPAPLASLPRDEFQTSYFDAQLFAPYKTSTSREAGLTPHFALSRRPASNDTYVFRPLDSATSIHSFSSLINSSSDVPNHPVASLSHTIEQPQNIQSGSSDGTPINTPVAPFNDETPNSPSFPNFRAIASAATTPSTMVSPLGLSSSIIDDLVDALGQEISTELMRKGTSSADDSNSEPNLAGNHIGKAPIEPCTTEESYSYLSKQGCPICNGICTICQVPIHFDRLMRQKLFEHGHRAQELERMAPNEIVRKWIRPLNFARYLLDTTEGEGDVSLLSWESCRSQIEKGHGFEKPTIIRECFADDGEWTPDRYANRLELAFEGTEVDVKWHQKLQPERVPVSKLVEMLRSQSLTSLSDNPPNVLNLPEITNAIPPGFLRADRYGLLNLIMERCRSDFQKHIGKQVHLTPFDIGSCQNFNILGWPGAFSGAHVDSNGATWVRNLFGYKLWMFVPKSAMGPKDWERFAADGDRWDPRGKGRAVILEPGDVFVMEHGLVHAVYTLGDTGPCLMAGGMFLDQNNLLRSLETLYWIGKNQNATNEPIAYQLAQLISTLEHMVEQNPRGWLAGSNVLMDFRRVIESLRSLGCDCKDCDDKCYCSQEHRRCTPLCAAHHSDKAMLFPCMLETGIQESDPDDNDSESSDEEYTE